MKVMATQEIDELIKNTVNITVERLKASGLLTVQDRNTYQKTEELLKNYNALSISTDPAAHNLICNIEKALLHIREDPYYEIVPLYYIGGWTREQLASKYNTSVATISRNKTRLIRLLKIILFPEDYVKEVYGSDKSGSEAN